jgi:transporter family-2 protein
MNQSNTLVLVLIAALGGIAVAIQSPLSNMIGRRLGSMESVFIVHIGGAILAAIILAFSRGGQLAGWTQVPWYALCAGFLGLVVIGAINITIPRIGAASTTTLIVVAQLIISALIDQMGWFEVGIRPITLARLSGIAFLVLGAWLMVRE